jgi:hypothetical protein
VAVAAEREVVGPGTKQGQMDLVRSVIDGSPDTFTLTVDLTSIAPQRAALGVSVAPNVLRNWFPPHGPPP